MTQAFADRLRSGSAKQADRWFSLLGSIGCLLLGLLVLGACEAAQPQAASPSRPLGSVAATSIPDGKRMWMTAGSRRFSVSLADTDAARAFVALLPLTLQMSDLNDNEKTAKLPRSLPAEASRPGTIRNGDLMLWGSDTAVVFYKTFESPYAYTRLGRIDDPAALAEVLGRHGVNVTFSVD
jgi:hypothetical protein